MINNTRFVKERVYNLYKVAKMNFKGMIYTKWNDTYTLVFELKMVMP